MPRIVWRGPCIEPEGALPNGIGVSDFAGSEKMSLNFPSSPCGTISATEQLSREYVAMRILLQELDVSATPRA